MTSFDAEQTAFLKASTASMDATLDAAAIQREAPSPQRDTRYRDAVQRMADVQVEVLAALDRLIRRGEPLRGRETVSALREQRASLALQLQRTLAEVDRLTAAPA